MARRGCNRAQSFVTANDGQDDPAASSPAWDPSAPVTVQTLEERAGRLPRSHRGLTHSCSGGFAGIGLLLAAIGIYGVIAFLVGQRTREVGVRMALGATPAAVTRMFLLHAAGWTLAGILAGLAGSLAVTRLLATMLFNVDAHDPRGMAAAPAVLLAVALSAAWLPRPPRRAHRPGTHAAGGISRARALS